MRISTNFVKEEFKVQITKWLWMYNKIYCLHPNTMCTIFLVSRTSFIKPFRWKTISDKTNLKCRLRIQTFGFPNEVCFKYSQKYKFVTWQIYCSLIC